MSDIAEEHMRLRRVAVYSKYSDVSAHFSTTLHISTALIARLNSCAAVFNTGMPSPEGKECIYNHQMLIRIRKGFMYEDAERAIVNELTAWYEEYCGGTEIFRTLRITQDSFETPEDIVRPTPDSPRAKLASLKIRRDVAREFGDLGETAQFNYDIYMLTKLLEKQT